MTSGPSRSDRPNDRPNDRHGGRPNGRPDATPAGEPPPRARKAPNAFRTISEVADDLHIPQH
ncbi:MAG: MerR family transcriptional regulator, partial [Acetobacteraceae bacterium]